MLILRPPARPPSHAPAAAAAPSYLTGMPGYAARTCANTSGDTILQARRDRFSLFLWERAHRRASLASYVRVSTSVRQGLR